MCVSMLGFSHCLFLTHAVTLYKRKQMKITHNVHAHYHKQTDKYIYIDKNNIYKHNFLYVYR